MNYTRVSNTISSNITCQCCGKVFDLSDLEREFCLKGGIPIPKYCLSCRLKSEAERAKQEKIKKVNQGNTAGTNNADDLFANNKTFNYMAKFIVAGCLILIFVLIMMYMLNKYTTVFNMYNGIG